jgi:hypothetical protein
VYQYLGEEGEIAVTKEKSKPVIKINDNGTITILPREKTNISKQPEKIEDYESKYFVGTKSFCSNEYEDDCIEITITENGDVSYSDPTDIGSIKTKGHINGFAIFDEDDKNLFIKYKPYHLYLKRGKKWIDFAELKSE